MGLYKYEIEDEVRKVRHAYAAKFKFDLNKLFKDIAKKEKSLKGFNIVSRVAAKRKTLSVN